METTVNIRFEQLLEMVKKLPASKLAELRSSLDNDFIDKKASEDISDFQEFLLKGPVMTKEQYDKHLADRQHFNAWRKS